MRAITKKREPSTLQQWKAVQINTQQNFNYTNLPTLVKNDIKNALLIEQGYLCAYTMRRLETVTDCHIEHVKAQASEPNLDLDYSNMVACFPQNGGDISHGYGAPIKADLAVTFNQNFISPHHARCASRFCYNKQGSISEKNIDDIAASRTIEILKLNQRSLEEMRLRALEAFGIVIARSTSRRRNRHYATAAEARRIAETVMQMDQNGKLEPFCSAIACVANIYANKEEKRSKRLV